MPKDLKIGQKANLLFEWHVKPVDYSEEQKKNIIKMASEKYGIPESQIKVVPCYITANADGTTEALTNTVVENIQSPEYQHQLFKKYLQDNNIEYTDEDFNEVLKIDGQINALINYDSYEKTFKEEQLSYERQRQSIQGQIDHLMIFINRFRVNANRAPFDLFF